MPTIRNLPHKINLDADPRNLQPNEMTDALNVRPMASESGLGMNGKNAFGNRIIDPNYSLPAGENEVIGSTVSEALGAAYYAVWNENGNHRVVRYSIADLSTRTVIESNLLRFNRYSFVDMRVIIGQDGEELVYMTDGINRPRKLNANDSYANITSEEEISWLMPPPLKSPRISINTDNSFRSNNIYDKAFQFCYRYVYKDGEISVFSPYTDPAIDPDIFNQFSTSRSESINTANAVDITVEYGNQWVERIEIAARAGNVGAWYFVDRTDNDPFGTDYTFRFYNDGNYEAVAENEIMGNYDWVPKSAETIEYTEDRMQLANAVDSYDNEPIDATMLPRMEYEADANAPFVEVPAAFSVPPTPPRIDIDLSSFVFASTSEMEIRLDFVYRYFDNLNSSNSFNQAYTFYGTYVSSVDMDDIGQYFADAIEDAWKQNTTFHTINYNAVSTTIEITFWPYAAAGGSFDYLWANNEPDANFAKYTESISKSISSFKSGAYHPFGLVYYDEYLQDGTAQIDDGVKMYVPWYNERARTGPVAADYRIKHTPPIWAKYCRWVYAKNTTTREFLQYSITNAFVAVTGTIASAGAPNSIYLSLRGLKGKPESYKDQKAAKIDYNFVEGDRLRVKYMPDDNSEGWSPEGRYIDVEIVDFVHYPYNEEENPMYQDGQTEEQKNARTGWFLVVESLDDTPGYRQSDFSGYAETFNGVTRGAVVEIYRPYKETENVPYYEFSEAIPIIDPGTDTRRHGQLDIPNSAVFSRAQGEQFTMTVNSFLFKLLDGEAWTFVAGQAGSKSFNFYIGDVIVNTTSGDTFVINHINEGTGPSTKVVYITRQTGSTDVLVAEEFELVELAAGGTLTCGDVYYRPRITYNTVDSTLALSSDVIPIEDFAFSDFIPDTRQSCYGRIHFYNVHNKRTRRTSTLWISQPYQPAVNFNGLSTFRVSEFPWKDYTRSYGYIKRIIRDGERLLVFMEARTAVIQISKQILSTGDQQQFLALNKDLLSDATTYWGEFGIGRNKEAVNVYNSRFYFTDIRRGKFLRLSRDGNTVISDYGVSQRLGQFAQQYLGLINSATINFPVGIDPDETEVYFTLGGVTANRLYSPTRGQTTYYIPFIEVTPTDENGHNVRFPTTFEIVAGPTPPNILQDVVSRGYLQIGLDDYIKGNPVLDFPLDIIMTLGTIRFNARYDMESGRVSFDSSHDSNSFLYLCYDSEVGEPCENPTDTLTVDAQTIMFHEDENSWCSRFSFTPMEGYLRLTQYMLSFDKGLLYIHDDQALRCNYYGVQYEHSYEFTPAASPEIVKFFRNLSTESTIPYDCVVETNLTQSDWLAADWDLREGVYYMSTMFDTSGQYDSNIIPIGIVNNKAGIPNNNELIVTGFNTRSHRIRVTDPIFVNEVQLTTVQSFEDNVVTVVDATNINVGDFVYVKREGKQHGAVMRGNRMKVTLTATSSDLVELFAMNTLVVQSKYSHTNG